MRSRRPNQSSKSEELHINKIMGLILLTVILISIASSLRMNDLAVSKATLGRADLITVENLADQAQLYNKAQLKVA